MLTRRRFCQSMLAATAGALVFDPTALRSIVWAADTYQIEELGTGRWLFSGGGGNILLLQTKTSPVLIDAGVGSLAHELLGKVIDHVGGQHCTLINTHHHGDHIGGNFAIRGGFTKPVEIIGHRNLTPRVTATLEESIRPGLLRMAETAPDKNLAIAAAEDLAEEDFAPTRIFDDDLELKIGNTVFQLHHFGHGHTDNDAVIHLPAENIVHMGDLIFNNLFPYVLPAHGATVSGWRKSLKTALTLCDPETVVIPGHGERGDRGIIIAMQDYFEQATEIVAAAIEEGRSREEIAAIEPEIFAGRGFERVRPMTLNRIYDELQGL